MPFIELHINGEARYINVDHITTIHPDGNNSLLGLLNYDESFPVDENPEQVIELIAPCNQTQPLNQAMNECYHSQMINGEQVPFYLAVEIPQT